MVVNISREKNCHDDWSLEQPYNESDMKMMMYSDDV